MNLLRGPAGPLLLCCLPVPSQELVWQHVGVRDLTAVQNLSALLGDVDGDGYRDLAQLVKIWLGPGSGYDQQIWTLSGRDGHPLRVRSGPTAGYTYWAMTSAGDMDRDGSDDYVVTLWDQGCCGRPTIVEVRSGRDEHLLWQVTNTWASLFGWAVLGGLDVDGDGQPDVLMTAPGESSDGVVYAYSNQGTLIHRLQGTPQLPMGHRSGWQTLGGVGDVDLDGADDYVVGGGDRSVPSGAGILVSGRTGRVLVVGRDERYGDNIGATVDGCGDMDGDGTPDFMAGSLSGATTYGVVRVFSGRNGSAIHTWRGESLGACFAATSLRSKGIDVDLDGVPDVLVGNAGCGSLWVFSGRDGSVIFQRLNQSGFLGIFATIIGVQPGSPFPCFAVAQPEYLPQVSGPFSYQGRLLVFRGSPGGVEVFGLPCAGPLPTTPRAGARDLGPAGVRVTVHGGAPASPAALLLGVSRTRWGGLALPYPLAAFGLPGCSLYTSVELAFPTTTSAGYAAIDIPTPLSASGGGILFAQWWCQAGSGGPGGLSDAVQWRF